MAIFGFHNDFPFPGPSFPVRLAVSPTHVQLTPLVIKNNTNKVNYYRFKCGSKSQRLRFWQQLALA
jgi:hypothetical protein